MNGKPSAFGHVQIFSFCPSSNAQSNLCTRFVNKRSLVPLANVIPGHPLLLAPNGINWKSCLLKSVVNSKTSLVGTQLDCPIMMGLLQLPMH